jgi:hypothetical protein
MGVVGYLDAGSGSMIVGAVAAGAAGVAVAAKVGWKRMTGVFGKKGDDTEPIADATPSAPVEAAGSISEATATAVDGAAGDR